MDDLGKPVQVANRTNPTPQRWGSASHVLCTMHYLGVHEHVQHWNVRR